MPPMRSARGRRPVPPDELERGLVVEVPALPGDLEVHPAHPVDRLEVRALPFFRRATGRWPA